MAGKNEKIRRKRIVREFNCYHSSLISASRYVKRQTECMFPELYIDVEEYWDTSGTSAVHVYAMWNGKLYHSRGRYFVKDEFDSMGVRGVSPEIYCRDSLAAEVFDLHAKILSKEDIDPVLFIREYKK